MIHTALESGLIELTHSYRHSTHIFTSTDLSGLYVASDSIAKAIDGIVPSVHTLLAEKLKDRFMPNQIQVQHLDALMVMYTACSCLR